VKHDERKTIYIQHNMRYEFQQRKNIAKAWESICFVFCEDMVLHNICEYWFRRLNRWFWSTLWNTAKIGDR